MNLYRFRSCKHLIDELKDEYIYLSTLDQLNDPMEGIRILYWKGNKELWNNLFKHYFFCLYNIIGQDSFSNLNEALKYFNTDRFVQEQKLEKILVKVEQLFLNDSKVLEICNLLSEQDVSEFKIAIALFGIGRFAICIIKKINGDMHPSSSKISPSSYMSYMQKNHKTYYNLPDEFSLEQIISSLKNIPLVPEIAEAAAMCEIELSIVNKYKIKTHLRLPTHTVIPKKLFIGYLELIKGIVNNNFYISAFSADYNNPVMWSHYAENHKGVCLIFNKDRLQAVLPEDCVLYKVEYEDSYAKINFFDVLPHIETEDSFMRHKHLVTKFKEWSYEQEFRIIKYHHNKITYDNSNQQLRYPFPALTGIIFGTKITPENRLKIVDTLSKKLLSDEEFKKFNFYNAFFSKDQKKISIYKCNSYLNKAFKDAINDYYY